MGIIEMEGYRGPSKLDERLEQYRDPESGQIVITPEEAREVLLDRLLGYLKKREGEIPPKIETLIRIAGKVGQDDRFDYTATLESVREESAEARERTERARREISRSSVITPPKPSQPEI